jgi:hypothetical protein
LAAIGRLEKCFKLWTLTKDLKGSPSIRGLPSANDIDTDVLTQGNGLTWGYTERSSSLVLFSVAVRKRS